MGLLYFHVGQLFAQIGKERYEDAIILFNKARSADRPLWNLYVEATISFLRNERSGIVHVIDTIDASNDPNKEDGNIDVLRKLLRSIDVGDNEYKKAYES